MNHYSPFMVAAMFKQLEAMYPRRIDLGMGRATSGRPSTWPCAAIANHNRWTTMPRQSWKSVMTKEHLIGLGPARRSASQIGSASCRDRVWQTVKLSWVAVALNKK